MPADITRPPSPNIQLGSNRVDLEAGRVHTPHGATRLSAKELDLLTMLAGSPGAPVPRQALVAAIWPDGLPSGSRALDVLFSRLRARVEPSGCAGRYLKTIRSEGYLLLLEVPHAADKPGPAVLGPLIGREHELHRVRTWLEDGQGRWLTLAGLGGVGKTRLAAAFASQLAAEGQPTHWVELAALPDGDLPLLAVAEALGLELQSAAGLEAALRVGLSQRRTVLFLDNLEHVPKSASRLGAVLRSAPGLRVIATSRRTLQVPDEVVVRLAGLDPEAGAQLLQERIAAVVPGQVGQVDHALAHEVSTRVDGLPLAIELAVATLRFRPPQALLQTLRERTLTLAGEHRGRPARQSSLEATFDYSWALLCPEAQAALGALSLFAGSFSEADAREVLGVDAEAIGLLLQQSLLSPAHRAGYSLHALVRGFADTRRRQTDPEDPLALRHRRWFLAWAGQQAAALRTEEGQGVRAVWARRAPDLRLSWSRAVEAGDLEALESGWPGISRWLELRDSPREVHRWCTPALETLANRSNAQQLCHRLLAVEAVSQEATEVGNTAADELLKALATATQPEVRVALLRAAGTVAARECRYAEADGLLDQALQGARELADPEWVGRVLLSIRARHAVEGRSDRGFEAVSEAVAAFRAAGNQALLHVALRELANVLNARDEVERATALLEEALRFAVAMNDEAALARTRHLLMVNHWRAGRCAEALALAAELEPTFRRSGAVQRLAHLQRLRATLLLESGRLEEAELLAQEALELAVAHQHHMDHASALNVLASVLQASGRYDEAVERCLAMRVVIDAHLSGDAYWDSVCSGGLAYALWLAGAPEQARQELDRALAACQPLTQNPAHALLLLDAVLLAEEGAAQASARSALRALGLARASSPTAAARALVHLGTVLACSGRAALAAALLPVLRSGEPSQERWIYLPVLEERLAGGEPQLPPLTSTEQALTRVQRSLEELADSFPPRKPAVP